MAIRVMPDVHSMQVAGFWAAVVGGVGTAFGLIIRRIGPWRQQISDAEHRIREALEAALEKEREAHAADLERERLARAAEARAFAMDRDAMGDRIAALEATLKKRDKMREAERAIERHRFNNLESCFNAFLMLVKANPDKVTEAIEMVEAMRANQLIAEAAEKAIFRADAVAAIEGDEDDAD